MPSQVVTSVTQRGLNKIEEGGYDSEMLTTQNTYMLEAGANWYRVLSRTTTAPPGSPADQDSYLIPAGPSGAWVDRAGEYAIWSADNAAWLFVVPQENSTFYVDDQDVFCRHDGAAIVNNSPGFAGLSRGSVSATITASVTQTQGQQPLTTAYNRITVCDNTNDTVTMPSAIAGARVVIWNSGAQTARVYPASGDNFEGSAVNVAITIVAAAKVVYVAIDALEWLPE